MDVYEWADDSVNRGLSCDTGFTQLLAARPYPMPAGARGLYDARLPLMRAFQERTVEIFRAALRNDTHPIILHWLMNETPESMGLSYHRSLEDRHFTLPVFFRSDEVRPGRLIEINCPAALWGELQLAFEYALRLGAHVDEASPAGKFVAQLSAYLGEPPIVHDYLDRASSPAAARYFVGKTRPGIRYWGLDRGVRMADCNYVRHRTFVDTWADDLRAARLARVGQGLAYEAPPYILFEEKAPLALPFWSMTRAAFPDEARDLFPYTTPLLPRGIELPDGTCISVDDFAGWPRSRRSYYAKYAGADWTRNFGSKAVYRLSNMSSAACLEFLRRCLSGYARGEIWLLQQEETQDDEIEYVARDGTRRTGRMRVKFGGFYGPGGCLGVLAMHSTHNKVTGREDTVLSYVVADGEEPGRP